MRNLLLSSCFIVAVFGCSKTISPYTDLKATENKQNCILELKPQFTSVLYNTKVDVIGKHLSGLLLFKTMPDSSTRVVFTNEMGVNFFDFEYSKSGFKVHSCMTQLNKKVVINQLRKDIGLVFMYNCDLTKATALAKNDELYYMFKNKNEETYYITQNNCNKLSRVEYAVDNHKKIIINMQGNKGEMPDSAYIAHQNFDFTISLKQLIR